MRKPNGILAAVLTAFFLIHALLGSAHEAFGLPDALAVLAWVGCVAIVAHIALSIGTTWQMMTDEEHPPSTRKKRHQVLKWVTGALVLVLAVVHVVSEEGPAHVVTAVLLACVLAWHACVGAKSLLKDISVDRRWLNALRIVVCVLCAAAAVAMIVTI